MRGRWRGRWSRLGYKRWRGNGEGDGGSFVSFDNRDEEVGACGPVHRIVESQRESRAYML